MDLDALLEPQQSRNHELGSIADGVDRAILDHDTLIAGQQALKGSNDLTKIRLITVVVVQPLGIENVVKRNEILGLIHGTTPDTTKLLHVCANTEQKTKMHAKGTDIGSGLAADPEDTQLPLIVELVKLALMDGTNTQLTLDGGNQGRSLEKSTSESLEGACKLCLTSRQLVVKSDHTDVLFSGSLLRLDETCGAVDANDEASSDLGIKGSTVAGLLNSSMVLAYSSKGNRVLVVCTSACA